MADQIPNPPPARRIDQGGQAQGIEAHLQTASGGGDQGSQGNVGYTQAQGGSGQAGQTQGSNQGQNAAGQQQAAGNA